jgi:hypothetical protein
MAEEDAPGVGVALGDALEVDDAMALKALDVVLEVDELEA